MLSLANTIHIRALRSLGTPWLISTLTWFFSFLRAEPSHLSSSGQIVCPNINTEEIMNLSAKNVQERKGRFGPVVVHLQKNELLKKNYFTIFAKYNMISLFLDIARESS